MASVSEVGGVCSEETMASYWKGLQSTLGPRPDTTELEKTVCVCERERMCVV